MKYAVILTGGKQVKVQEGETVAVEKLAVKANDSYTFDQVLLFVDGDKKEFGKPNVTGVVVTATVVGDKKTAKVRVAKFKAKAKYRRVTGSRKIMTYLKIDKIGGSKK